MVSHFWICFRVIVFQFIIPLLLMICVFISSIGVYDNYIFKIITESMVFLVAFIYLIIKIDMSIHNTKSKMDILMDILSRGITNSGDQRMQSIS